LNCPRCKLPLQKVDYEGVEVDMCNACWGFWLDTGELEEILRNRDLSFSEDEKDTVLDIREASSRGPTAPAPCPSCRKVMDRVHYDAAVSFVIDRCPDHGIWLDTGEIKKVQALAEKSKEVHRILLRKLGLLTKA